MFEEWLDAIILASYYQNDFCLIGYFFSFILLTTKNYVVSKTVKFSNFINILRFYASSYEILLNYSDENMVFFLKNNKKFTIILNNIFF